MDEKANPVERGSIIAHYDVYGFVTQIKAGNAAITFGTPLPQVTKEKIKDLSKWPFRIVPGQKASEEDLERLNQVIAQEKYQDAIFEREIEDLKTDPRYRHLVCIDQGDHEGTIENIENHLVYSFPQTEFFVRQKGKPDRVVVMWQNRKGAPIVSKEDVLNVLRCFMFGFWQEENGEFFDVHNPFSRVFGGVNAFDIREPYPDKREKGLTEGE